MRPTGTRFFDEASPQLDRFGGLLGLTCVTVGAMSLIDVRNTSDEVLPAIQATALGLAVGGTLLLALRAAGIARRWRLVADVFVGVASLSSLALLALELGTDLDIDALGSSGPSPIWILVAIASPLAVIRRLLRHKTVSRQTLAGAIAAYLLIALAFSIVFLAIDALQDGGFFAQGRDEPTTSFIYFSLVTVTTVGYGDLSPATEVGRLLATTEAVLGQVYLVTVVAMVVGLLIQQRGPRE